MQSSQAERPRSARRAIIVLTVGIAVLVVAWLNRYNVYDWVRLRGYSPSPAVVQLASETTMVNGTRRMFYAYHPLIEGKTNFGAHCPGGEKTIVLGCYISGRGIYLYKVEDNRLQGIMEVTAAHETLHAAYERLGPSERKRVNAMLQAAYAHVGDTRIRNTIQDYQRSGADVSNELHSILATEVRELPAELEAYYSRYFTDRKVIVAFSEAYEKEFSSRKDRVAAYDRQLAMLKEQIDTKSTELDSRQTMIKAEYERLQSLRNSGQVQQYNAGVAPYNQSVNAYNAAVAEIRQLISDYNSMVELRNELVVEQGQLQKAIDSRPDTLDTQ
jgi:hypothetical protein